MYEKLTRIARTDDPRFSLVTALVGAVAGWGGIGFIAALAITVLIAAVGMNRDSKKA